MSAEFAIRHAAVHRGMVSAVFGGSVSTIVDGTISSFTARRQRSFSNPVLSHHRPVAGTLASLATDSAGFFARPIGGAIFGHFGDRIGRKVMLMITMAIIALGTFAVGCLLGAFSGSLPPRTRKPSSSP